MTSIKHKIKHYYQPTNNSCGPTGTAILLSYYGKDISPERILAEIPLLKDEEGNDWGTLSQHLAMWCMKQGFGVDMYTADFQLIDLSWAQLSKDKLLDRMELAKNHRDIPALGKSFSKMAMQAYIDFIHAGGRLHIQTHMTTELINSLLGNGPIAVTVCYPVMHGPGRYKEAGLRKLVSDDLDGNIYNHFIVIYGRNDNGDYLIADPFVEPGLLKVDPEKLLCAMTAAQIECENALFQLNPLT